MKVCSIQSLRMIKFILMITFITCSMHQSVKADPIGVSSYIYDGIGAGAIPSTSPTFPDTGGVELTNGLLPSSTSFGDAGWVGFQDPGLTGTTSHPQVTFDFGSSHTVNTIDVTYLHSTTQAGGTITAPEEVLISVSSDNVTYSAATSFSTAFDSSAGNAIRTANIDVSALANAQYYRLDFRNSSHWTFLSEVEFKSNINTPGPTQAVTFGTTGGTNSLEFITGWEFSINQPITVTHLGRVDMLSDGITNGDVGIWRELNGPGNSLLAQTTVTSTSPSETSGTGHRTYYEPIAPLVLEPGNYIVATQRNGENFYFDQPHTTAPGITWVEGEAAPIGPLPAGSSAFTIDRNDVGSYFGANFKFESSGGGDSLSLSNPTGRAVFQRNDSNVADVKIEGTYTGSPTRIEARAVPRAGFSGTATDWQVIEAAPAGGSFSANLQVRGGWYDLEVRTFDGVNELDTASVQRVGVGEVFITAGQSNSANHGSPQQQPDDDRVSARTSVSGDSWQLANDSQPIASGGGGSPWPELGDLIASDQDVPVGFISVGVGSTTVAQWLPGTGNYNNRLKAAIESLGPDGFRAILWHQGESDSLAGTTAATYADRLQTIIDQSRVDAGFDVPWGVALASFHPSSSATNEAKVFAGQEQLISDDPLVFEGPLTDDFHLNGWLSDTVHFNQTGLDMHALRWFEQMQAAGLLVPIGDINLDGSVDADDLAEFLQHYGTTTGAQWQTGDFNADGKTGLADLLLLKQNFGKSYSSSAPTAVAVPEPPLLALSVIALVGLALFNWRKKRPH